MPRESNAEFNEKFRRRTFEFALNILKYLEQRKGQIPWAISNQLTKSTTSIGANFRAFCRGRSGKERYAKICIVVEEADETVYWIELINEGNFDPGPEIQSYMDESLEILKISASIKKGFERYS